MTGVAFLAAWLLAPGRGLVAAARRRARQRLEFAQTMLAIHLANHEGKPESVEESRIDHLDRHLRWEPEFARGSCGSPSAVASCGRRGRSSCSPRLGASSQPTRWPARSDSEPMPEDHFGERVAERFDERYAHKAVPAVVDPIVAFLADLAGEGAALELGIGTGRIALPLARRGVRVHGIDLSEAMVAQLRAKPGAEQIGVTIGDFATTTVDTTFSVAYLVANTIMNLTTQDEQVACFQNVSAHLEPGGCFVIEVLVPELRRLPPGETFRPFDVSRGTSGSTSTTWLDRASSRTTTGSPTARSRSSRPRSATSGRRSST